MQVGESTCSHSVIPLHEAALAPGIPRIAVIDDDPIFGRIMERLGRKVGVDIRHFKSFESVAGFDVIIADYDLGSVTGLDIARLIDRFHGDVPMVMVSRTTLPQDGSWPACIKEFVHKGDGPLAILDAATEVFGLTTIGKNIRWKGQGHAKVRRD